MSCFKGDWFDLLNNSAFLYCATRRKDSAPQEVRKQNLLLNIFPREISNLAMHIFEPFTYTYRFTTPKLSQILKVCLLKIARESAERGIFKQTNQTRQLLVMENVSHRGNSGFYERRERQSVDQNNSPSGDFGSIVKAPQCLQSCDQGTVARFRTRVCG